MSKFFLPAPLWIEVTAKASHRNSGWHDPEGLLVVTGKRDETARGIAGSFPIS